MLAPLKRVVLRYVALEDSVCIIRPVQVRYKMEKPTGFWNETVMTALSCHSFKNNYRINSNSNFVI
eukprot:21634-Amphidinium_carterae.1